MDTFLLRRFCLALFFIASLMFFQRAYAFSPSDLPPPVANYKADINYVHNQTYRFDNKDVTFIRGTVEDNNKFLKATSKNKISNVSSFKPAFNSSVTVAQSWGKKAVMGATKLALKSLNVVGWALTAWEIIDFLKDSNGWFLKDNQLYTTDGKTYVKPENGCFTTNKCDPGYDSAEELCSLFPHSGSFSHVEWSDSTTYGNRFYGYCYQNYKGNLQSFGSTIWMVLKNGADLDSFCPDGATLDSMGCAVSGLERRVTDTDIDNLDLSNYPYKSDDFFYIYEHLGKPDSVDVVKQPDPIDLPTEIKVTTADDGSQLVTEQQSQLQIDIQKDSQGNLYANFDEMQKTNTYKDGQLQSSNTVHNITNNSQTSPNQGQQQTQVIDCELTPTLCKIQNQMLKQDKDFQDWVKEDFNPEMPNFKPVQDVVVEHFDKNRIDFGSRTCPAPITIDTKIAGRLTLTFDAVCKFASWIKYLVLASAYLIACRIVLGAIRG